MSNELGIENIKVAFTEIIDTSTKVFVALEDGFQITDIWVLVQEAKDVPVIISSGKLALREFGDLSTEESEEIANWFEQEFDIPNDELEAKIEKGIKLLSRSYIFADAGYALFEDWKEWYQSLSSSEEE